MSHQGAAADTKKEDNGTRPLLHRDDASVGAGVNTPFEDMLRRMRLRGIRLSAEALKQMNTMSGTSASGASAGHGDTNPIALMQGVLAKRADEVGEEAAKDGAGSDAGVVEDTTDTDVDKSGVAADEGAATSVDMSGDGVENDVVTIIQMNSGRFYPIYDSALAAQLLQRLDATAEADSGSVGDASATGSVGSGVTPGAAAPGATTDAPAPTKDGTASGTSVDMGAALADADAQAQYPDGVVKVTQWKASTYWANVRAGFFAYEGGRMISSGPSRAPEYVAEVAGQMMRAYLMKTLAVTNPAVALLAAATYGALYAAGLAAVEARGAGEYKHITAAATKEAVKFCMDVVGWSAAGKLADMVPIPAHILGEGAGHAAGAVGLHALKAVIPGVAAGLARSCLSSAFYDSKVGLQEGARRALLERMGIFLPNDISALCMDQLETGGPGWNAAIESMLASAGLKDAGEPLLEREVRQAFSDAEVADGKERGTYRLAPREPHLTGERSVEFVGALAAGTTLESAYEPLVKLAKDSVGNWGSEASRGGVMALVAGLATAAAKIGIDAAGQKLESKSDPAMPGSSAAVAAFMATGQAVADRDGAASVETAADSTM